jgi:hypothetical protein
MGPDRGRVLPGYLTLLTLEYPTGYACSPRSQCAAPAAASAAARVPPGLWAPAPAPACSRCNNTRVQHVSGGPALCCSALTLHRVVWPSALSTCKQLRSLLSQIICNLSQPSPASLPCGHAEVSSIQLHEQSGHHTVPTILSPCTFDHHDATYTIRPPGSAFNLMAIRYSYQLPTDGG